MNKYINIKDVSFPKGFFNQDLNVPKMFEWLNSLPSADVQEVLHGCKEESTISNTGLMCTVCYSDADMDAIFCKYCGAMLDGGKKLND